MIILKYNEKPEDWKTRDYETRRLEYGRESDVMWYTKEEAEIKHISEIKDEAVRKELFSCLSEWHDIAKEDEDQWPVKYASVEFWIPEGQFAVYPGDLGSDISEYEFETIYGYIVEKLRDMGAVEIHYTGMLD